MTKILFAILSIALSALPALALAEVTCVNHPYATCTDTGQTKYFPNGKEGHLYRCTCGDKIWVM